MPGVGGVGSSRWEGAPPGKVNQVNQGKSGESRESGKSGGVKGINVNRGKTRWDKGSRETIGKGDKGIFMVRGILCV